MLNKKVFMKNVDKVVKGLAIGTMSFSLLGVGAVAMNNDSANSNVHASSLEAEMEYANNTKTNPDLKIMEQAQTKQDKILANDAKHESHYASPARSLVVHQKNVKRHAVKRNRKSVNHKRRALKRVHHARKNVRKHSKKVNYAKQIKKLHKQIKQENYKIKLLSTEVAHLKK